MTVNTSKPRKTAGKTAGKARPTGRRAQVRKVGGSFTVTLPKDLCDELNIQVGTAMDFELQGEGGILLQPHKTTRENLRPRRAIKSLLKEGKLNREIKGWDDDASGKGELV